MQTIIKCSLHLLSAVQPLPLGVELVSMQINDNIALMAFEVGQWSSASEIYNALTGLKP